MEQETFTSGPAAWEPERGNWSTTQSATFHTAHPERFSEIELAAGHIVPDEQDQGWVTVPVNGLSPDCEPADGLCACGRSAWGDLTPDQIRERYAAGVARDIERAERAK